MTQAPDEREAIVRWLRDRAASFQKMASDIKARDYILYMTWRRDASILSGFAHEIERGDHLSEQGEGYE